MKKHQWLGLAFVSVMLTAPAYSQTAMPAGGDEASIILRLQQAQQSLVMNDLSRAAEMYEEIIDANENNVRAHLGLARVRLIQEDYDEALEHINDAIELDPVDSRLYFTRAQILEGRNGGLDDQRQALDNYLMFSVLEPEGLSTVDALSRAARLYDTVRTEIDENDQTYYRGLMDLAMGLQDRAVTNLREALNNNPDDATVPFLIGKAYEALNQPEQAIIFYQSALREDEDNPLAFYYLSQTYQQTGDRERALETWRRFAEQAPYSSATLRMMPTVEIEPPR